MAPTKLERQECIVYSRVVGWLTPVKNYNPGKAAEYKDRKVFKLEE
jgi:ribonucleoside-triphosphate reductase